MAKETLPIELLRLAISELGELADLVVFVGGAVVGIFNTDPTPRIP